MAPAKFEYGAISNGDFFDYVRTMREIHALHAKGAVLNKREWWVKWTTMPEVRAKWLLEIKDALVKAHVSHAWSEWRPHRQSKFRVDARLAEIAVITNEESKKVAIQDALAQVMYPPSFEEYPAFQDGIHYEEDENEAEDDWMELEVWKINDPEFEKVFVHHKKMYAVCQVAWYVAMAMVRDELRSLSPAEWTRSEIEDRTEQIWSADNEEVVACACKLICSVIREGPCTVEVLRVHLPAEQRPNVLQLLQYHFTKIRVMLENTKTSIESDLDIIAEGLNLDGSFKSTTEPVHVPGPAPRTWMSDNCIPGGLKSKFVAEIAKLEDVADDKKDWHPNANNQVLNLVHPSLFCGVAGETKLLAESEAQNLYSDPAAQMRAIMFAPTSRLLEGTDESAYQWLPCEIDVADDKNSARIRTYINNLHPEDHAAL